MTLALQVTNNKDPVVNANRPIYQETGALISHAAAAVCEHQSSAVVPPAAACREHSDQPGTSVSLISI